MSFAILFIKVYLMSFAILFIKVYKIELKLKLNIN